MKTTHGQCKIFLPPPEATVLSAPMIWTHIKRKEEVGGAGGGGGGEGGAVGWGDEGVGSKEWRSIRHRFHTCEFNEV